MKQKFFEIENNRITLFPNEIWKIAGLAFAVAFPLCWLAFLIWAGLFQWFNMLYMAVGNTIVMLPFFYAGSQQIIVNGNTQTIQRKSWFGSSKACHFTDVADVQMVNTSYRNINSYYYKLTLKKNPYGRGIRLNSSIVKTTPHFARFQNTAIPFIKKLLAAGNVDNELTRLSRIETEASGFKIFHQKEGVFISKPVKTINLVLAVGMLGLGICVMFGMENTNQFKKEYYALFALAAFVANMCIWGERAVINPSAKTIEKSYIGLFKKIYPYQYIIGFNTLRYHNGLGSNGIDVIVEIQYTATQKIKLFSKLKSKKAALVMEELKRILAA